MQKLLNKFSLRSKLLLLSALLIGIAGLSSALYVAHLAHQTARDDLSSEAAALTQWYQRVLLDPLRLGDEFRVYELIVAPFQESEAPLAVTDAERELGSIVLLDDAGKVLASSHPLRYPLNSTFPMVTNLSLPSQTYNGAQQQHIVGDELLILQPLGESGVKYANLLVSYSLVDLQVAANRQVLRAVLLTGLLMLLLMVVMGWLLTLLTRPILTLNQDMHDLAAQYDLTLNQTLRGARDEVV